MRARLASVLTCLVAMGCGPEVAIDDEADETESELESTAAALTAPAATRLDALPSPVAIHAAATGLSSAAYATEWSRLNALGYHPVSLSSTTFNDDSLSYSSVFHKDANVTGFYSWRGLTDAEYSAKWTEYGDQGYRPLDVVAHATSSGMRYDGVWVKERTSRDWRSNRNMSLSSLSTKLAEYKAAGLRPIRLHGYANGSTTQYSGVWVKDALGTDYRVILDKNSADYGTAFDANVAAGYYPQDISAYPVGNEVRFTGVFVKDASITRYAALRTLSEADYRAKQREYAEANFVQVDAEHYSTSATGTTKRYAGTWIQRANHNVVSNLNLSNTSGWPANATAALTRVRNAVANYDNSVGFIIEDLTNGNYLGYHVNDPFYMASTAKVMIAARVMDRIDAGTLTLNTNVRYNRTDLLESTDSPTEANCNLAAPACADFTVLQSLRWMINNSSTNATDRLMRLVGQANVNAFLEDNGIVDIGEVTSICEVDRRMHASQNACVNNIDCFDLVRWNRNNGTPDTQAERNCVNSIVENQDASTELYYATHANSITPLQYGRFWRRILEADIMSTTSRDSLVENVLGLTGNGWMTGTEGTHYRVQAGKFGGQHETNAYVAVGYGTVGGTDEVPQFAIALFTEDWPSNAAANKTAAEVLLQSLAADGMLVLTSRR